VETQSVIQYVLSRLHQLGIADVFGVADDYAFPISDAIIADQHLRWVGCCNELNAAYAADGYARLNGVAAVNTTYSVGELSAINAIIRAGGASSNRRMCSSPRRVPHRWDWHSLVSGTGDRFGDQLVPQPDPHCLSSCLSTTAQRATRPHED
jgi:hypothetical protein